MEHTRVVDGLRTPVEVVYDRWGAPQVRAHRADDAFAAQGFTAARDPATGRAETVPLCVPRRGIRSHAQNTTRTRQNHQANQPRKPPAWRHRAGPA
ncbi:penicillin acylase family protein [Nocardiopsis valliformis]|uniref:penicillin acylase family protein n=1 Tax=Nocardiopsis valliformis TaxID=239974 RepID=UPI00034DA538|nr:penicillin acylase family protein [Nocardiopsis valliformis]